MTPNEVVDKLKQRDHWEDIGKGMRARKYFGRGKHWRTLYVRVRQPIKRNIVRAETGAVISTTDATRTLIGNSDTNEWREA